MDAFLYLALFFFASLSVYLFWRLKRVEKQKTAFEMQLKNIETQMKPLQLQTLEAKLSPHLLKNIFNSIQSHAYQTYFALDKLANVLDYMLYESRAGLVSPKDEIAFALNLIEINKIKLSPLFELKVKTKIEESDSLYAQKCLAPFLSIDLIENAFKHADLQSSEAFISIIFEFQHGCFSLTVSNKISEKNKIYKEKGGIGTQTLEQRLQLLYQDRFRLEHFAKDEVFMAQLKIDLREKN